MGAPTYDFAKFCEKLHEIEKILGRGGGGGRTPGTLPLNPPLLHIQNPQIKVALLCATQLHDVSGESVQHKYLKR